MKFKRPRLRAQVACAVAVLGTSTLLAGGVLAAPAAASAGGARQAHSAHRPAQRSPSRSDHRAVAPKPARQASVRLAKGSAEPAPLAKRSHPSATGPRKRLAFDASDVDGLGITPNNTFFLQLDVRGASQSPGAPVIDWWTNWGANQGWDWQLVDPIDGIYIIQNQNSGQCLTTDGIAGDQVYQEPCNYSEYQEWYTNLPTDYDYSVASSDPIKNVASGLYLDVNGDSPWPGASIDTWYYNGNSNQYFRID